MKRAIVLAVISALSQAMTAFAGPEVSSKQVVAPPPPPPESFFRPNEFDIGAFATWAKFTNSNLQNGGVHGWGGGMDFTYWFPWKYAGVRFQGTGLDFSGGGDHRTETVVVPGFAPVTALVWNETGDFPDVDKIGFIEKLHELCYNAGGGIYFPDL